MNKKRAFTLAELMIVMLVVTLIFAAFAPMITKRRIVANRNNKIVWNWFTSSKGMDAYYIPAAPNNSGTAFFGTEPSSKDAVFSQYAPNARIVVNANKNDQQFRFYYRPETPDAASNDSGFIGKWQVNTTNMVLGGSRTHSFKKDDAQNNVIVGYNAGKDIKDCKNNTLIGYNVARNFKGDNLVAIGANVARFPDSSSSLPRGVFVGNGVAGSVKKYAGSDANDTIAIGYYASNTALGLDNICIGEESCLYTNGGQNTAIGKGALHGNGTMLDFGDIYTTGAYNNIAIGYDALRSLHHGKYNTAIGYNACKNLQESSYKTCIGANSGPSKKGGLGINTEDLEYQKYIRTYIGAPPKNFGGDAVLEIHNVGEYEEESKGNLWLANTPKVHGDTTTVINGNLVVMGNTFLTFGNKLRRLAFFNNFEIRLQRQHMVVIA